MMLNFSRDCGVFNVRTVGVLVHDGQVLLHRAEHEPFWTLPGGRIEFSEDAATALVREVREELETDAHIKRLLWVVENFFVYNDNQCHELAFYFLLALEENDRVYTQREFIGKEEGCVLLFQWFPLSELDKLNVKPVFLKTGLLNLPDSVTHVVHRETTL